MGGKKSYLRARLYIFLGCAQTICYCLVWPAFGNSCPPFPLLSPLPLVVVSPCHRPCHQRSVAIAHCRRRSLSLALTGAHCRSLSPALTVAIAPCCSLSPALTVAVTPCRSLSPLLWLPRHSRQRLPAEGEKGGEGRERI